MTDRPGVDWDATVAVGCRYGECAKQAFPGVVLFEESENDYQGYAWVLVALTDGRFALYDWTYGSCSGCDEWESADLSGDAVVQTMKDAAVYFDTWADVRKACGLDGGERGSFRVPTANSPTNGSVPGMLHFGLGGIGSTFDKMVAYVEGVGEK